MFSYVQNDVKNCFKNGENQSLLWNSSIYETRGIACFGVKCSLKATFSVRGMLVFAFSCRFTPCLDVG